MMPARNSVLFITIALALLTQPHSIASALPHLFNDTLHTQNGSFLSNSTNFKASLPNPSDCDTALTRTFTDPSQLFEDENTTMELFNFTEISAENASNVQHSNRTLSFDRIRINTTAPCINMSSPNEDKESLHQHKVNSSSDQKDSLHSMDLSTDNHDLWADLAQMRTATPPPGLNTPIHTAASISSAKESVQVMVISGDDDLVLINDEQFHSVAPPAGGSFAPIRTADPRSTERESVQVMVISGDDVFLVNEERLGGTTPPPGSDTPIHTASQRSVARDSLQVTVIDEHDVGFEHGRQLGSTTPPPGMDTPINTAAQSSVATDQSVQVMVIEDDDEVVVIDDRQLSGATTPPGTVAPIHRAASSSVARESMQVMVLDDGSVVTIDETQLRVVSPPPGAGTPIHTAAARSVAQNSGIQIMVVSDTGDEDRSDVVLINDVP